MKKNSDLWMYSHPNLKKLLMVLKIQLLIILVSVSNVLAITSYSQMAKVSLSMENTSLEQVMDEIENQSEFYFIFNQKQIDVNRVVSIQADNKLITDILPELFKGQDVNYAVFDKKVLLTTDPLDNNVISIASETSAQQNQVAGTVTDEQGIPLPGVSIGIKGTLRGALSDAAGKYTIVNPPQDAILVYSYIGMATQEIPIEGRTVIDIVLITEATSIEDVVVVGYGVQKKASLTGSVVVVKVADIKDQAIADGNILKAMDGRMPGLTTSYTGNPNNYANVLIRGRGSLSSSTAPLVIVDGVPTNRGLNELATNDIESIQVLKDASAATIYGSRAANGVYIITTKSAKKGAQVEINSAATFGFLHKRTLPLMNTEEHGRAQWMAARNDGVNPNYGVYSFQDHQEANGTWVLDEIILPDYLDEAQTMKPADTDWGRVISRTAITQNHNVTISNGGEFGNVLVSFDYLKSQGTTKENEWNRGSLRVNSDYKLFKGKIKIGENISVIKMRYTGGSYLGMTPNIQSIVPVHTVDGIGWGGPVKGMSDRNNPLLVIMNNRQNHGDDLRLLGSIYADAEIIKNLHFKSTMGVDYDGYWNRQMNLTYQAGYMSETVTKMQNNASYGGSWTWNNVLNYNIETGNNYIQLMVGQEATEASGENIWGARDGFASESMDYMFLDVGERNVRNGGLAWDNAQNSYFGRINYDFKHRYLLTAIVRRDGSSRFGANNRYAIFPSISAGWVISEESFMDPFSWISTLKIRYGWGKTGNQEIDNYASYAQYQAHYGDNDWPVNNGTAYDIYGADQGNLPSGYRRLQLGNPDLRWEATAQHNFGLDFALMDSKLSGSFDYYIKTTEDILVKPPTLTVTGYGASAWINGATMKNWGWEANVSYGDKVGDFGYVISVNGYHNTNEFTDLIPEAVGAYPGNGRDQIILGRPLNSMYGYVADGIFQNQAEVDAAAVQPGKGVGRLRFKDVNNDGKIDADDRDWIGVNEPKFAGGLNVALTWRGFDYSILWVSELGREIYSSTKRFTHFFGFFGGQNYGSEVLNSWSPTNTSSDIPAITAADINNEQRYSSYFVENTSFLKLQAMSIGYNLPESIAKKVLMKKARIFIQGENLLTFKMPGNTFTGFDPKSPGVDFPLPTSFTIGANLIF